MTISNTQCIARIERLFTVSVARSAAELAEVHRLRYQIYCTERHFLPGNDGWEMDAYDDHSVHVALRRRSGELIGTVRLVMGLERRPDTSFPMQVLCPDGLLGQLGLPIAKIGEVSRFAISRVRRDGDSRTDMLLRLALMRGVLQASIEAGVTHWCAIMEASLFRLLRQVGVDFIPIGAPIVYNGVRRAAVAEIAEVLVQSRDERPELWNYVTEDGRLATAELGYAAMPMPMPAPAWQPELMRA
jgi:N-acyl-L-homoserine lactone synthetase